MNLIVTADGVHPTTEACIAALEWLHARHQFENILEIGCGSGILSVIAANIWQAPVLAVDMVEKAVIDTRALALKHHQQHRITTVRSDGFSHTLIKEKAPYDLIICNLVAATLISLMTDIKKSLALDGYALISGTLEWLASDVDAALESTKLKIVNKNIALSWVTYIVCHA